MSYERILSIQSLNDVANPWKGFTMNRCLALALLVVVVSSSVNELHGAMVEQRSGLVGVRGSGSDTEKEAANQWQRNAETQA
ncbi:hypothetical protein CRUP_031039 [Coryphaenoides rupestris]|nr:hypothetical protein CRUP_031039 [Coryphaenoides rupestris]